MKNKQGRGDCAWPKDFKAFEAIMDSFGVAEGGPCAVSPKATEEKAASPQ